MRAMNTNNNPPQISLKYCIKPFDDAIYTEWTILNYKYGLTEFNHSFSYILYMILYNSLSISLSFTHLLSRTLLLRLFLSQYFINWVRHSRLRKIRDRTRRCRCRRHNECFTSNGTFNRFT